MDTTHPTGMQPSPYKQRHTIWVVPETYPPEVNGVALTETFGNVTLEAMATGQGLLYRQARY
jgi:hypothetical protein